MTEATFKNSKEQLSQEKMNLSNLQRSLAEVSKYLAAFMLFVCAHTHKHAYTQLYSYTVNDAKFKREKSFVVFCRFSMNRESFRQVQQWLSFALSNSIQLKQKQ